MTITKLLSMTLDDRETWLAKVAEEAARCASCPLSCSRHRSVFARGSPFAEICFVGEGPGPDDESGGEPFAGRAGKLLDRMISAMGYQRSEVYVCNVVKCRPPEQRKPTEEESYACSAFLDQQVARVKPRVIVALGGTAAEALVRAQGGIVKNRGKWKLYKGVIPVMPTFHPNYLLRCPEAREAVADDLAQVAGYLAHEDVPRMRDRIAGGW